MSKHIVRQYYAQHVAQEWRRLARDAYHRLEFATTMRFIRQYFPKRGLVLDAGGGPGRYTIELAKSGYDVVLHDLAPENLSFAKRKIQQAGLMRRVKALDAGSITDLRQYRDGSFDAVICLGGPLSHVLEPKRIDRAVSELVRVAKKGAPILVSVMSRLAILRTQLLEFQNEIGLPVFTRGRDAGHYAGGYGFTACRFFLPEEFRGYFTDKNVKVLSMAGLEGLASHCAAAINKLARNKKRWKIWMETHYKTCTHPAVAGMSEHMLLVCRKR
jgi:ubiquinone/menaquinone biosynthesis C-methylase UbiE